MHCEWLFAGASGSTGTPKDPCEEGRLRIPAPRWVRTDRIARAVASRFPRVSEVTRHLAIVTCKESVTYGLAGVLHLPFAYGGSGRCSRLKINSRGWRPSPASY